MPPGLYESQSAPEPERIQFCSQTTHIASHDAEIFQIPHKSGSTRGPGFNQLSTHGGGDQTTYFSTRHTHRVRGGIRFPGAVRL